MLPAKLKAARRRAPASQEPADQCGAAPDDVEEDDDPMEDGVASDAKIEELEAALLKAQKQLERAKKGYKRASKVRTADIDEDDEAQLAKAK
eukprot:1493094-Prymnesium_polylepis.1